MNASRPDDRTGRTTPIQWLALLAMAAIVPVCAAILASARGPFYLAFNTDPEYAYLLNSLLVAEGRSPFHTDHPGTPLQMLGAAVLHFAHVMAGQGTLRDDVLTRPEFYLQAMQVAIIGAATLLSLWAGRLAVRATGSLAHAAVIQCTPVYAMFPLMLIDRVQPEPLLLTLGMTLGGAVLVTLHRPPGAVEWRNALVMGVLIGVGTATKVLFAPLALVPLAALSTWRSRAVFAAGAAVAGGLAVLPMAPMLGRTWRWMTDLATHSGRHGQGTATVVDWAAFPQALIDLASRERAFAGMLAAGAGAALWFAWRRRGGRAAPGLVRTLAAVAITQGALLLLVAKHPAPHYLTSAASLSGLSLSLIITLAPLGPAAWARRTVIVGTLALIAAIGARHVSGMLLWRKELVGIASSGLQVASLMRSPEGRDVLHGIRISTPESALSFGNLFSGATFTRDLIRLYPDAHCGDWSGVTRFGTPLPPGEVAARFPDNRFDAVVSGWQDARRISSDPDAAVLILQRFGNEELVRVEPRLVVPSEVPQFFGFRAESGLDNEEPPTPQRPWAVRWGLGRVTRLTFDADGRGSFLAISARPNRLRPTMDVSLNGKPVHRHQFGAGDFEPIELRLDTVPGQNTLELAYSASESINGRELSVLFRRLQVVPVSSLVRGEPAP